MHRNNNSPLPELIDRLEKSLGNSPGQKLVRTDPVTRLLYSTDASIYQVEPLGVVFPRSTDDLCMIVDACSAFKIPMLPRGSGSSLAGQAIGPAMIIDCTRFLNKIIDINVDNQAATVEPGVILADLNRSAKTYGLQFGPDPASAERATIGGCIANNATGAHSIRYGMVADHLIATDMVLSDNTLVNLTTVDIHSAEQISALPDHRQADLYRTALRIRQGYTEIIERKWPRTWRCASGYNINYLVPWTAGQPPCWYETGSDNSYYPPIQKDHLNLSHLIAGSEGTLGIIARARLKLVPLSKYTILGVLAFPGVAEACDEVPKLLLSDPSAIELIPFSIIDLARSVPAYAHQLGILGNLVPERRGSEQSEGALLIVEFSGDSQTIIDEKVNKLGPYALAAREDKDQKQIWAVRKVGLGIMMSRSGDQKPWAFIEDLSVPTENLGKFIREMERIFTDFGTNAEIYAHASAGCLHIRPIINLKTLQGVTDLRHIAERAVELTISHGGAVSGEHGIGIARGEWLRQMFGDEIIQAFQMVKKAADPDDVFNPGKFIGISNEYTPPRMDEQLRFGASYHSHGWQTQLDFSAQNGIEGAIEQCNGAGVCRKSDGVMCPSFQATKDEMHSTRGRSNLLRAMISSQLTDQLATKSVYEALDLCLACKGCKAECPSAVDMAKLKYEFINHYYKNRHRHWRDYIFAYIGGVARFGNAFAPISNYLLHNPGLAALRKKTLGISTKRTLPTLSGRSLHSIWPKTPHQIQIDENVLLLSDAFTEYFFPSVGIASMKALEAAGCNVILLPVIGAGRTLISKGFLEAAQRHAKSLLFAIEEADPTGEMAVIGIEPSEIYTLRDEYLDLLPKDPQVKPLANRAYMIDEYLIRGDKAGSTPRIMRIAEHVKNLPQKKVLLHGHCYQKAQPPAGDGYPVGVAATIEMLKAVGYEIELIQAGCCGMAGAFGYEIEHYELSQKVGELGVFRSARTADPGTILAASGVSCKEQIQDAVNRKVVHPIELVFRQI